MTLILAQASNWFVLQVSDRLLTRGGVSFDPISNKNLLYFAPDAVVSFGYTGPAYLAGVPTDQWLAELLTGRHFERGARPASLQFGPSPRWLHIGPALQLVSEQLHAVFVHPQMNPDARRMMFELVVAGWQWGRRGRARPIMAGIRKDAGASAFQLWRAPRHFGRNFMFAATPENLVGLADVDALRADLRAIHTPDDAERVLAQTIRLVSQRTNYVGADCMSILLPPPVALRARVRFIPATPAALVLEPISNPSAAQVAPAAFSPWVISGGLVHAPSIFTGTMILSLGSFEVVLEAPEPPGPGLRAAMGSINRPPEPR